MDFCVEQRQIKVVTSLDLLKNYRAEDARMAISPSMLDEKAFSILTAWSEFRPKGPVDCMYLTTTSPFLTVQDR